MYREREVYIHGYHHIIVSYNILYYIIGRTRTHMLNDYTKQAWSEPVKIVTVQRRFAWPLRKDDTHKSRSVNNFRTTPVLHVVPCVQNRRGPSSPLPTSRGRSTAVPRGFRASTCPGVYSYYLMYHV